MVLVSDHAAESHLQELITILVSDQDRNTLAVFAGDDSSSIDDPSLFTSRPGVVKKPWGFEFLLFENDFLAAWFLHLDSQRSTSFHCHPLKNTSIVPLSSSGECRSHTCSYPLTSFNPISIEAGAFHAIHTGDLPVDLIEIETPPNKGDVIRAQDRYGRSGKPYEGEENIERTSLERFGYCRLSNLVRSASLRLQSSTIEVALLTLLNGETLNPATTSKDHALYILCDGALVDTSLEGTRKIGDFISAQRTNSSPFLIAKGGVTLLSVVPR